MPIHLWYDYVASLMTDQLGGMGIVYVIHLDITGDHMLAQFMMLASLTTDASSQASPSSGGRFGDQQHMAAALATASGGCAPLFHGSAFAPTAVNLTSRDGRRVDPQIFGAVVDACATSFTPSFKDECAGSCNVANVPVDIAVAGHFAQNDALPTCPPVAPAPAPIISPVPRCSLEPSATAQAALTVALLAMGLAVVLSTVVVMGWACRKRCNLGHPASSPLMKEVPVGPAVNTGDGGSLLLKVAPA